MHLVDVADDVWDDEAGVVELPEELRPPHLQVRTSQQEETFGYLAG